MVNEAISKAKTQAIEFFSSGFNCAESVSRAILNYFGMDPEIICGAASGFGGGFGRYGSMCGAVSGGVIAIGTISNHQGCRNSKDKDKLSEIYQKTFQLVEIINKEFESSECQALTGVDLRTQEGRKRFSEERIRENICEPVVSRCTEKVIELLQDK
ncbi:MAG: C-GCAxxG-C-C family (seleno)protein [Promethearchaeota archaeon]